MADLHQYRVRVTRNPLTEDQIREEIELGTLAPDYRSRARPETDYVDLDAPNDTVAALDALTMTKLVFKGELPSFHEVDGPNERELEIERDIYDLVIELREIWEGLRRVPANDQSGLGGRGYADTVLTTIQTIKENAT